jgi:Zn finger protein HypA/HybF involved in hydrogenase expression
MKCKNCGMGFVVAEYNVKRECPHCGHMHEVIVTGEPNMIKKLWKKFVSWLFSWQK